MPSADHFAAEQPDTVSVSGQSFIGQPLSQQVHQKGIDEFDNALPDNDIAVFARAKSAASLPSPGRDGLAPPHLPG